MSDLRELEQLWNEIDAIIKKWMDAHQTKEYDENSYCVKCGRDTFCKYCASSMPLGAHKGLEPSPAPEREIVHLPETCRKHTITGCQVCTLDRCGGKCHEIHPGLCKCGVKGSPSKLEKCCNCFYPTYACPCICHTKPVDGVEEKIKEIDEIYGGTGAEHLQQYLRELVELAKRG